MARTISSGLLVEINATSIIPMLLAKLEYDSGDLNIFTGQGTLIYDGDTYLGGGDLIGISGIEETQLIKASGITMALSGIPSTLISDALNEEYTDRNVSIWFAALNASYALITTPLLIFKGRMDVMTIDEGPDTSSIELTAENRLISLERPSERRYTDEEQKADFAGDKGFEYVTILNDGRDVEWRG